MPASRKEQIILAVVAAIDGDGPITLPNGTEVERPEGLEVDRSRKQPLTLDDLPRISVYTRDVMAKRATASRMSPVTDDTVRLGIAIRVADTEDGIDPFYQWANAALMRDQSLGGLAIAIDRVSENSELDEDAQGDYSVNEISYEIRYAVSKFDLTAQS